VFLCGSILDVTDREETTEVNRVSQRLGPKESASSGLNYTPFLIPQQHLFMGFFPIAKIEIKLYLWNSLSHQLALCAKCPLKIVPHQS
jgi:hypothetical protein